MKKNMYKNPDLDIAEALEAAVEVEDFLPPPSELVKKGKKEKITIQLDSSCIQFFKDAAEKNGTKYQTLINTVLAKYVEHYSKQPTTNRNMMLVSDTHEPRYKA